MSSNTRDAGVIVGIGSNLGDPVYQVQRAMDDIAAINGVTMHARSSLYESKPMGTVNQPDYINAVVRISTARVPLDLLDSLQKLERSAGRPAERDRWGARILDLDLLVYGDCQVVSDELTVPHAGIPQRDFVLRPIFEIAPDLAIPGLPAILELLRRCPPPRARQLELEC